MNQDQNENENENENEDQQQQQQQDQDQNENPIEYVAVNEGGELNDPAAIEALIRHVTAEYQNEVADPESASVSDNTASTPTDMLTDSNAVDYNTGSDEAAQHNGSLIGPAFSYEYFSMQEQG